MPRSDNLNLRKVIAGHQAARIVPDPERAPLVTSAFEHYATGEWTLQRLAGELAHKGLNPTAPMSRSADQSGSHMDSRRRIVAG